MPDLETLGAAILKLHETGAPAAMIRHKLGISEYLAHKAVQAVGGYPRKAKRTLTRTGRPVSTWPSLRAQLLQDGRKALGMIEAGHKPRHVLMVVGGSRARLYRAIDIAAQHDSSAGEIDPLLV
jgi:hypothetical protein